MELGSKQLVMFFLGEINKMRVYPKAFLKHMQDRVKRFDEENPKIYGRGDIPNLEYKTIEGASAVKETHDFLMAREEGRAYELSYQLCEAAYVVGGRISRSTEHVDIRDYQTDLLTQLASHKCKCQNMDVIIEYGFRKDRELVPSIIIDDGNELRTRRQALLSERYNYIGLAVHQHRQFDYQLLILLADDVEQIIQTSVQPNCQCILM